MLRTMPCDIMPAKATGKTSIMNYTTRSKSNHVLEGEMTMLVTMSEPKPCQRGRKLEKQVQSVYQDTGRLLLMFMCQS